MNIFVDTHQKLLRALNTQQVSYLLVGGYAVVYHGYRRTTGDMDLWLEPTNENKVKLLKALKEFDFYEDDIEYIGTLDFTKHLAFNFWEEPERVDCLTYISNVEFDEAYQQKVVADIEGIVVPVIQYNHLVLSKISSDRLKDKADIEELQKIKNKK